MSWIGPLISALVGGVTTNIANKGAAQNADNAQNIGLARNAQAGAAATGALNNYWKANPFFNMKPPSAPGVVSGAGAPSMQAPPPPGTPAPQEQGHIPPELLAALHAAMQAGPQGGQPPQQPGPPVMRMPSSPPRLYGQGG
jgi:hypothetical protein